MALRLPWIARLLKQGKWGAIINARMKHFGGLRFLLQCNYEDKYFKTIPIFYRNMLKYFSYIFKSELASDIIWNNKDIKIDGKPFYLHKWNEKGITFIQDLLDENGQWLPIDQFKIKFNINETNFMQYFNLISASTKLKRELFKSKGDNWLKRPTLPFNNTNIFTTVFKQNINIKNAKCRDFYPLFIENNLEPPIATIRWSDEGVNNHTFYSSMTLARWCTRETKLLSTQYKIIHHIWPHRKNLARWNIALSDHCNFCGTKDDTFHAFAECPCSTNWLHNILIEIDIGLHYIENVTIEEFIFGVESEGWNNIFLVLKYYLGQCRLHGKLPMVIPALHSIYRRVLADKIFKTETGFYIKWGTFPHLIQQSIAYGNRWHLQ